MGLELGMFVSNFWHLCFMRNGQERQRERERFIYRDVREKGKKCIYDFTYRWTSVWNVIFVIFFLFTNPIWMFVCVIICSSFGISLCLTKGDIWISIYFTFDCFGFGFSVKSSNGEPYVNVLCEIKKDKRKIILQLIYFFCLSIISKKLCFVFVCVCVSKLALKQNEKNQIKINNNINKQL